MKLNIALLPGDGIGPEVICQAVKSVEAVCLKFGHEVSWHFAYAGACAIDRYGDAFPEVTYKTCKDADAVLFGAVGDPKYDNDPTAKVRPEQGLLAMRKQLGLYSNLRPVETFKSLVHQSPLKEDMVFIPPDMASTWRTVILFIRGSSIRMPRVAISSAKMSVIRSSSESSPSPAAMPTAAAV